jgi:hypothetical protein
MVLGRGCWRTPSLDPVAGKFPDTMQPVNYAAKVVRDCATWTQIGPQIPGGREESNALAMLMASAIAKAQHFSLPDSGAFFDKSMVSMHGQAVRLPFPFITVSFYVENETKLAPGIEQAAPSHKRFALAMELPREMIASLLRDEVAAEQLTNGGKSPAVMILPSNYSPEADRWLPSLMAAFVSTHDWEGRELEDVKVVRFAADEADPARVAPISVLTYPMMPRIFAHLGQGQDPDTYRAACTSDLSSEVRAVLNLCEALSCSNVRTESIEGAPAQVNAKRERAGKLPLLATHILTLETPVARLEGRETLSTGDDKRTVRQHLRRGHIRRLEGGQRKIWVNACVVGSDLKGRIDKAYDVVRAGERRPSAQPL